MEFYTYKIVDLRKEEQTHNPSEPEHVGTPSENNPLEAKPTSGNGGGGSSGHSLVSLATFQKIGSMATSFGGNHIATYMGSTAAQNRFNAGMNMVGTAVSIIDNPIAGLAMLALNTAKRAMEVAEEKRQDNMRTGEARKRAGANFNSSRL